MREISTKDLKVGEHIIIDGVEYVAESINDLSCDGCDIHPPLHCPVPCGNCVMVKVEKQPTDGHDKDTPMTNLQLAEWLAKGHGQYRFRNGTVDNILIRPWGTDEWVRPTVEIYERDCR